MIASVRKNAGLGDPPDAFYTNDVESENCIIKREVEFKKSDIPSFVQKMHNLEQKQAKDAESALFEHGPYSLAPAYKSLRIEQHKWFKLNAKQRESFIHKFWNTQVNDGNPIQPEVLDVEQIFNGMTEDALHSSPATQDDPDTSAVFTPTSTSVLSVATSDCQISGIPAMQMQGMLEKAERLLCDPGSIIPAPSNTPNSFCVRSESNKKSHFVYQLQSSGKTICEDCPQWFSSSICAHSVAVAEKCGNLRKFINWRKAQSKGINITKLINYDGAKGVGKKPHQRSRSRARKPQAPVSAPSHVPSPFPSTVPSTVPLPFPSTVPSPFPSLFPSTVPSPVPSPTPSPIYHTMPNQVNQVLLQCFIYTIFILANVNYCHL